eukprot:225269_1
MTCNGEKSCISSTIQSFGGTVDMNCDTNLSCHNVTAILPQQGSFNNGFFSITQNIKGACSELRFKCGLVYTKFVWDDKLEKYQCDSMDCCPWNPSKPPFYFANNTISCAKDSNCTINGSNVTSEPQNPFYPKYDVTFMNIDGSMANNLGVECNEPKICISTNITCAAFGCNVLCNGQYSCNGSNIFAMYSNTTNIVCNDVGSCNNMSIADITGSAAIICSNGGSCKYVQIMAPNASSLEVYCGNKVGCSNLNIVATMTDYVNVTALGLEGMDNALTDSYIDARYVARIDVRCNGLCSNNKIDANYSTLLNVVCDTKRFDGHGYFGGCNQWTVNAHNAKEVNLNFTGQYAAPNGIINVSNATMVNVRFESDIDYDEYYEKNNRS